MSAEEIVSPIAKEIGTVLVSIAKEELRLVRNFKSDFQALESSFSNIQKVLQHAEKKGKEVSIQRWLKDLRAASFQVENLLDEVATEDKLKKLDKKRGRTKQASAFFSARNPGLFRSQMAHKVKRLRERLEKIDSQKSEFQLETSIRGNRDSDEHDEVLEEEGPDELGDDLGLRNEEKEKIIELICDKDLVNQDNNLSVTALWGMGGIGKSTLAGSVHNDRKVREHFELIIWVHVPKGFSAEVLLEDILRKIDSKCDITELEPQLRQKLLGKRFLLVLDDVWAEENVSEEVGKKWERLERSLGYGAKGSMVLVTTRIEEIALIMAKQQKFIHHIGNLLQDKSRELFERIAFAVEKTKEMERELKPIGYEIADKCEGLPLALKALGSLLRAKASVSEWQSLRDSEIWDLPKDLQTILPALKLSYDYLPQRFRRCFAYCSMFPKPYKMGKDTLITLWIANGLIPHREGPSLYHLGEETFNCLVSRSFFQDVAEGSEGQVTCKMHDLMHDLAKSVMGNDCSVIEYGKKLNSSKEVLHLYASGVPGEEDLAKVRYIRSMFISNNISIPIVPQHICNKRYLRVLVLTRIESKTLPKSICKLKLLRYLDVSYSAIEALPESIIFLQNLLALNLHSCGNLSKLPKRMRYMSSLRFLDIEKCDKLDRMPPGMGQLSGLQRLGKFIVGQLEGEGIEELEKLNHLGWELEITGLSNVRSSEDAKKAKLKDKKNLISVKLGWSVGGSKEDEKVLEALEPHPGLKKLAIRYYYGLNFPSWIVKLNNLTALNFQDCYKWESLPQLGALRFLKVLRLLNIAALKSFHDDDCSSNPSSEAANNNHFLSLRILDIHDCNRLTRLPRSLPNLERLDINGCLELDSFPDGMASLASLSHLSIKRCPNLKWLPDGLHNLKKLKYLDIRDCAHLKKRRQFR